MKQLNEQSKVHLISLGCARNRVDAEVMLGGMVAAGWKICQDAEEADAVVVNTCGFIGAAKEESIDTILEIADIKKRKPSLRLVVTGCLTQRYKNQLAKGLPEVDFFIGTDEFPRLANLLASDLGEQRIFARRTNYLYEGDLPKLNTLSRLSAYVKVAEGCQHKCAFCIIPAIRGPLRSRPISSVVAEVEKLASEGVVEINLIAQDLAAYGREQGQDNLLPLLKALVRVDGIKWIRMLYVYPEHISDEFLEFFAGERKLVKYLDIPVQHASDRILKAMNRDVNQEQLRSTIARVRAAIPDIAIRTTVMAGFPGETAEDFQELLDFVREQRFEHLGCFAYSAEEGTVAARMPDQIADSVKASRVAAIMQTQRQISQDRVKELVGQELEVLVEGISEESDLLLKGRLATQAPEVDGVVLINDGVDLAPGLRRVLITGAQDYDLIGSILGNCSSNFAKQSETSYSPNTL